MTTVLRILKRDILRIVRVPTVWIVILGLIFLSPLYAWFNIIGFWNPYGNTGAIRVAVSNEDKGATEKGLGTINLGHELVSTLKSNDDLGWTVMDSSTALDEVRSGSSYAAIVIPSSFSADIIGVIKGTSPQPKLQYYVNEKINGIAAKVTDTGATTVEREVNSAFVAAVSRVVASTINKGAESLSAETSSTSSAVVKDITTVRRNIAILESVVDDLDATLSSVPKQTARARQSIATTQNAGIQMAASLKSTSALISSTQSSLNTQTSAASSSLDSASSLLSQAASGTNLTISALASQLTQANGTVGTAIDKAQQVNSDTQDIIDALEALDITGIDSIVRTLDQRNESLGKIITSMGTLNTSLDSTISSTASSSSAVADATQSSLTTADKARHSLNSSSLPQLNTGLTSLSQAASTLGGQLTGQDALLAQTTTILNQADAIAQTTRSSLASTKSGLKRVDSKLDSLSTDLTALGNSTALTDLLGSNGKLDVSRITAFMLSPTVLSTTTVYPVDSYGSGMSPLFTNISLWVGAFVLMVIVKLETDDEDLDEIPTPSQRYWGRWLFLAILATFQALATTIGDLVIGVQTASPGMFILTGVITSLVYLSITYALSTTFMHVGKGLCVALIMIQIPGASGIYPIEMMPRFFRILYPFFPFTYSISALRETIGGFYGLHWLTDILKLLVFAILSFVLGLVIRPHLASVNKLFAREIKDGDMILWEPVQLPGGEYRLSQAIHALSDRDDYRKAIEARASAFAVRYPRLKHGALITGILVPAILVIVFSLTTGTKLLSLAVWVVWILLIIGFLMAIELMRDSIERQIRLGSLSDDAIRGAITQSHSAWAWAWARHPDNRRPASHPAHAAGSPAADAADTTTVAATDAADDAADTITIPAVSADGQSPTTDGPAISQEGGAR